MSYTINAYLAKIKKLLYLEEAVRYGSVKKAAEQNGLKQSNMSALIKDFEKETNQKLITRLSKGIKITEAGYKYYASACDIKTTIQKLDTLPASSAELCGSIKLWISDGLGLGVLSRCFHAFYQKYPHVNVEITCSLDMPKLDEFDMALIFHKPQIKALTIKEEYTLQFGLFASKEYLGKFGIPKDIPDLCENHKICDRTNYASYSKKWAEIIAKASSVTSVTNSSAMLLSLIKDGLGIGLLPLGTASKDEDLIQIKNIDFSFKLKFWLVLRRDTENQAKIKALTDIIDDESAKL